MENAILAFHFARGLKAALHGVDGREAISMEIRPDLDLNDIDALLACNLRLRSIHEESRQHLLIQVGSKRFSARVCDWPAS
jgi:hypothetical protein